MDKNSYLIFEAYKRHRNSILNELAPVEMEGGYTGSGEEVKAEFPELSKGKYDLTPEETSKVLKSFIDKFKAGGGKSPKLYKDFYEMELAPVVRQIKTSINSTNSKYTARVLYNALKEAGVLKDERDGVKLEKGISEKGSEKLAKFTLKNADKLGKEEKQPTDRGGNIDDPVMKRFWERILGEGEYSRAELQRMIIEDNPDMEESEARTNISGLIMSGYIKKMGADSYTAVDPEEQSEAEEKEGEGTGEITTGFDPEDVDDFDKDPYGGVYTGKFRGDLPFD